MTAECATARLIGVVLREGWEWAHQLSAPDYLHQRRAT